MRTIAAFGVAATCLLAGLAAAAEQPGTAGQDILDMMDSGQPPPPPLPTSEPSATAPAPPPTAAPIAPPAPPPAASSAFPVTTQPLDAEPAEGPDAAGGSGLATAGAVVLGIGGLFTLIGIITGGAALSMDSELDTACNGTECPRHSWDDIDTRDSVARATDAMLVLGALSLGTGLILVLAAPDEPAEGASVAIGPTSTGNGAMAAAQGRF